MRARRYIAAFSCFVLVGTPAVLRAHGTFTVGVGIQRALNSEWQNNRWGPVVGNAAVPSSVDANGFLFASVVLLTNRDLITREGLKSMRRPVE